MRKLSIIGIVFLLAQVLLIADNGMVTGCAAPMCSERMWAYTAGTFDAYIVNADHVTSTGILYDPSAMRISPALIDRLTDETEACLIKAGIIVGRIDRHSFTIKVAGDWLLNCDKTQQVLPIHAPDVSCLAKGMIPDAPII
jgi:hypothetical protein